ncbi:membrane-bound PQQ-dependent dehydrogenase, glucose/quinate/shikimate family [Sphingobium yanoikuyae]|uniref:Membrane-bound PQQ-dependent dehydrogenase, glucose/quinate/shikimate family n=1 Tax=Sphingobium yanoikuyae TaxID=13690 RepID=A0A9X7YAR4_SPHYA|nr:membrane-bound PQQ-dependent dehydrogenase, glucose/quinate/shikimate family [Sphingobium yanoikuyae]QNG43961.1 membrane-bound PQQ-dependent dehydrogenase, glucose/quinate/shikimate family [Sphingobium yanoikuyae]
MLRFFYATLLMLIGLALAAGGAYLAVLGGSFYYLIAGLALGGCALLLWRRDARASKLYGALLIATLIWAVWECGFNIWALVPRIVAPAALGLGFLIPAIRQAVGIGTRWWRTRAPVAMAGVLTAAVLLGAALHAFGPEQLEDPLYQAGVGQREMANAGSTGIVLPGAENRDWLHYGNDAGGSRYSKLNQINRDTVSKLKVAWEYRLGPDANGHYGSVEVTPLKVNDLVYLCTAYSDVIALDAETGREKWRYHAKADIDSTTHGVCRGVAYYRVPDASGLCAARIISNTIDGRLVALDASSGEPCPDFGDRGVTSLMNGMGPHSRGYYFPTSAPTLIRGKVVIGGLVLDNQFWGEPSGVIRAFDALTGKFAWAFDVGRPDDHGEPAHGTSFTPATPNSWAPMSADEALGMVYVPTGNATPDWYGAQRRPFDEKYSSSVMALDAETGAIRWSFQTAHHDLWDYDVASQPTLIDLPGATGPVRALIQPTKRGEMFLLDRVTGKPLSQVVERPAPQKGSAPGERLAPTQPFSDRLPSFRGADLQERNMWGVSPIDQLWCRIKFREARYDGTLTPPGPTPSIVWPGGLGGSDWGGVSVDPTNHTMIVNSNRVAMYVSLLPRSLADRKGVQPRTTNEGEGGMLAMKGTPFALSFLPFLSPLGVPCTEPPYSRLTAVDLVSHKVQWSKPLGTMRDNGILGLRAMLPITMGVPTIGGSLTTGGELIFIGATPEKTFRAVDLRNGKELWSARLPAGGLAGPMTYWSDRSERQFVVVAAGGNAVVAAPPGDSIIAYALPAKSAAH